MSSNDTILTMNSNGIGKSGQRESAENRFGIEEKNGDIEEREDCA